MVRCSHRVSFLLLPPTTTTAKITSLCTDAMMCGWEELVDIAVLQRSLAPRWWSQVAQVGLSHCTTGLVWSYESGVNGLCG